MTATVAMLSTKTSEAAARIDEIANSAMGLFSSGGGSFAQELAVAQAIADLRKALTPELMAPIMHLMNTDLGFRCDRPNDKQGPYELETVRDVFIEARIRGFRAVGNEFNIIAGRFYAAKNGLRRKVTTWPGLSAFRDGYDLPRLMADKGAVTKAWASWRLDGADDKLECELAIRVNNFMGADAIVGKAERKLMKRVHDRLAGWSTADGEVGEDVVETSEGTKLLKDDLRAKAEAVRAEKGEEKK